MVSVVPGGTDHTPSAVFNSGTITGPLTPIAPIRGRECFAGRDCDPAHYIEGVLSGRGRGEATVTMDVPSPFTQNNRLESLRIDLSHREAENAGQGEGNGNNGRDRITDMWFTVTGLGAPRDCRSRGGLARRDDWTQDTFTCDIGNVNFPLPDSTTTLKVILHIATTGGDRGSVSLDVDQVALRGAETAPQPRAQACDCDAFFVNNNGRGNTASAFVWGTVVLPTADVHEDFGGSTTFGLK